MTTQRKYGVATVAATHITIPMIKAGVTDFATSSDWTPAAGDVKVSKDGGAAANIATLPTYLTSIGWVFALSAAELTCKRLNITVVDSATKTVEDQALIVETYGHASAMIVSDLDAISEFDATSAEVTTDAASRTASQATGFSTHSAADVLTQFGTGSDLTALATQASVDDIPTNAEFAAAFPANFDTLAINVTGHVSRVTLVDTTTSNTDMRGTDGANTTTPPTEVGLADGAITAAKFDGSTAFPLALEDSGSTQIARTGADSDTLETLSDEIAGVSGGGSVTVSDITAAALAKFLTQDTGETVAVDGSVGRIAQGAAADPSAQLTRIENQTSLITAGKILINSNVNSAGDVTIYIGDDDVGDHAITISIDDQGETLKTRLDAANSIVFGAGRGGAANEITGTIDAADMTHVSGYTYIVVEITAEQKAGAKAADDYEYHIKAVDSSSREHVDITGCLELKTERAAV